MRAFADEAFDDELRRLRVRLEDKEAIAALHWRGVPDEEDAQAAIEEVSRAAEDAGFVTHWGRKVLEIRPPVRIDKGAGIVRLLRDADLAAALYVGDDLTDVDAFRGLDELVAGGRVGVGHQGRRALRRGPAAARAGGRPHGRGHRRRPRAAPGARGLGAGAVRRVPAGGGAAQRRVGDRAGGDHGARRGARVRRRRGVRLRRLVDGRHACSACASRAARTTASPG